MAFSPRSENEDQKMQKIRRQKLASDFFGKAIDRASLHRRDQVTRRGMN